MSRFTEFLRRDTVSVSKRERLPKAARELHARVVESHVASRPPLVGRESSPKITTVGLEPPVPRFEGPQQVHSDAEKARSGYPAYISPRAGGGNVRQNVRLWNRVWDSVGRPVDWQ